MSDVNLNRILNNYLAATTQNSSSVSNSSLAQTNTTFNFGTSSTTAQNFINMPQSLLNSEVAQVEQQQITVLIKELSQLPKELDELFFLFTSSTDSKTAQKLLSSLLDMNYISQFLQQNGKNALANLYKMLASYNQLGQAMKSEQVSELAKLINTAVLNSTSSQAQTLKTVMLMYLPWLPLNDTEAFKLEIAEKKSGATDDSEDSITILITTMNYGNIQVVISKVAEDTVQIQTICSSDFPQGAFESKIDEHSRKYNVTVKIEMSVQESFNKEKNEERKMQISMNTSPGVNPFLILLANSIISTIHEIDDMQNVREKRSRQL